MAKATIQSGCIQGPEGPCSLRKDRGRGKGGDLWEKGVEGWGGRKFIGVLRCAQDDKRKTGNRRSFDFVWRKERAKLRSG